MPRMRQGGQPLKRIALRLALFLLLGAIINIVVAWGCTSYLITPRAEWIGFRDVDQSETQQLGLQAFIPAYVFHDFNGELSADEHVYLGLRQTWYMPRYRDLDGVPD